MEVERARQVVVPPQGARREGGAQRPAARQVAAPHDLHQGGGVKRPATLLAALNKGRPANASGRTPQ